MRFPPRLQERRASFRRRPSVTAAIVLGLAACAALDLRRAEAADVPPPRLRTAQASGGESRSATHRAWLAIGEPAIGRSVSSTASATLGFLAGAAEDSPFAGSIVINGGAAYTATRAVTLALDVEDEHGAVTRMRFSEDNVTYTPPEPFAGTRAWTLTGAEGLKVLYVTFSDPEGNTSPPASASITLDLFPPEVTIDEPADGTLFGARAFPTGPGQTDGRPP